MDHFYAERYRDLYEGHWWWRAREDLILGELDRLRPAGGWGRILDVGCGDGLLFDRLSRFGEVEGIEMDPAALAASGPWADRIQVRPFDETFQPLHRYGLVLMLDVIEHFERPLGPVRRALQLLEPGGTLLITVPAFGFLWTSHDELNHHFRRYSKRALVELVRGAGGKVESARYFFNWLFPIKLAAHFREALSPVAPATPRIPPKWLNAFLRGFSRLEARALRTVPVPFGSSLVAVARPG